MNDVKLLVFVCTWCSYGGADHAGGLRLGYPPGVRLIRVMCSGRVDPETVLRAYRLGADGVMILGCHPGDCHYKTGNINAAKRAGLLADLLQQLGLDRRRFRIDWVSTTEGERFSKLVNEMYRDVQALGPLRIARDGGGIEGVLGPERATRRENTGAPEGEHP